MTALQRYAGEPLGQAPHIVVLGSCKLGNFVVSTPVLMGLRRRFPDACIGFIGSCVTQDFEVAHPVIDWRVSWDDPASDAGLALQQVLAEQQGRHGPVNLAVNLDGYNPVTCAMLHDAAQRLFLVAPTPTTYRTMIPWGDSPQQRFLADPDWDSLEFLNRYQGVFSSNYIAELFCHLALCGRCHRSTSDHAPIRGSWAFSA